MEDVDREMERWEQDAEPERFSSRPPHPTEAVEQPVRAHSNEYRRDRREALARTVSGIPSSSSSDSSSSRQSSVTHAPINTIPTQQDGVVDLERNRTALSRIHTARSQHSETVGSGPSAITARRTRSGRSKPLPEFGAGKPYPPPLPEREEYVVEFDGVNDALHAQNWPLRKKLVIAAVLGFVTLTAAFGSSVFSAAVRVVSADFGVSTEVGTLGISLYVLGFATGPILWAPISELYGRRVPLIISSFGFSVFSVAVAVGKDLQTVLICRFFGGFMGAAPLTIVAAVFADMFNNRTRGIAVTLFSVAVFSGPLLAPFIGGFITISYLGWRWTQYIVAIMGFFGLGLILLFLEETYPPVILVDKARELRRRTRNWGIHARQEEIEVDLRGLLEKNLSRPLRMLFTEPIVLALSVYMAFIYGLLYLFLTFYPIVFQEVHGMNPGVGGLPYFGIVIGELLAGTAIIIDQPNYIKKLARNGGMPVPEWRLPIVIAGGVAFSGGLFWFGWTGFSRGIPWIVPTLSGLLTGFGLMSIFLQCLNYLVDAYLMFAASAIAANTFLRSLCGSVFPLFATYMIDGMGIQWAGTLLGCVAALLVPLPLIFYLRGAKIREKSSFAPTFPKAVEAVHAEKDIEEV